MLVRLLPIASLEMASVLWPMKIVSAHGLLAPIDAREEELGHGPQRQLSLEQALHALLVTQIPKICPS